MFGERLTISGVSIIIFIGLFACHSKSSTDFESRNVNPSHASDTPVSGNNQVSDAKTPAPVSVRLVKKARSRAPLWTYFLKLQLKNTNSESRWYLIRENSSKPLASSGSFVNDSSRTPAFSATRRLGKPDGGSGQAVIISYLSKDEFMTFRLPGKGSIRFDELRLLGQDNLSEFEIWEAKALMVNGKTPLEDWLPFNTLSEMNNYFPALRTPKGLGELEWDLDNAGQRKTYPQEKVEFVRVDAAQRWVLPLK